MATLALTTVAAWVLAALMHSWPALDPAWRRRLAIATSLAGLASLFAAVQAEGMREAAITAVVVVGPTAHTATASASASLYYYVLTAACLSLGFVGLAAGEPLARWLHPRRLTTSIAVAWLITLVRFLLEKSAAPPPLAQAVGVTLMAPVAGAYLAGAFDPGRDGWRPLVRTLIAYAYAVRLFVAAVGFVATRYGLGTHYDVSGLVSVPLVVVDRVYTFVPGSLRQLVWLTLLPQLLVWPLFTLAAGLAGAMVAWRFRPQAAAPGPAAA